MALPELYYASPRGQVAVVLLAALRDLYVNDGWRNVTKRQAIGFISRKHWFTVKPEDQEPYPSQHAASGEPRWHTLIAWARKDSVLRDLVSYEARDAWGITRSGRDAFDRCHSLCRSGTQPVGPCFLWSEAFKGFMCPDWSPSSSDARRPRKFYRDIWTVSEKYIRKAEQIITTGTWSEFAANYRELTGEGVGHWIPGRSEQDVERLGRMLCEYVEAKAWRDMGL